MSYKHLNIFKRTRIEVLSKMGYSTRQIARELKRNTQTTYQAELADQLTEERRLVCHRPNKKIRRSYSNYPAVFSINLVS